MDEKAALRRSQERARNIAWKRGESASLPEPVRWRDARPPYPRQADLIELELDLREQMGETREAFFKWMKCDVVIPPLEPLPGMPVVSHRDLPADIEEPKRRIAEWLSDEQDDRDQQEGDHIGGEDDQVLEHGESRERSGPWADPPGLEGVI